MTTPSGEGVRRRIRCWTPIFLGRGGNQPLSLVQEYRQTLQTIRARRTAGERTWRTGVFEHYGVVRTIVGSLLEQFRGLGWGHDPALFASERRGVEEQALESCNTTAPPHKTKTGVGPQEPPFRATRSTHFVVPNPWKRSRWSETPSRGLLRTSQNPNGDDGVQRCGVGCRCSQCFYYGGWF